MSEPMHQKILLGEYLPDKFWYWDVQDVIELRKMLKKNMKLWDIAEKIGKPMNHVGAAIYLLDMEGRLMQGPVRR